MGFSTQSPFRLSPYRFSLVSLSSHYMTLHGQHDPPPPRASLVPPSATVPNGIFYLHQVLERGRLSVSKPKLFNIFFCVKKAAGQCMHCLPCFEAVFNSLSIEENLVAVAGKPGFRYILICFFCFRCLLLFRDRDRLGRSALLAPDDQLRHDSYL